MTTSRLTFKRSESGTWESVWTGAGDDDWVAQIHHPKGARQWDVHFRDDIPPESYPTRKAAVTALEAHFAPKENT